MKTLKKISVGLALLLVAAVATLALSHKGVLADVVPSDISAATYTFQDGGNIIGDFGNSGKVDFYDKNTSDTTYNYVPQSGGFCDPGNMKSQNGVPGNIRFGIDLQLSNGATLNSSRIPAYIKLGYMVGSKCTGVLISAVVDNPGSANTQFQWNGNTITTLNGAQRQFTLTPAQNASAPIYLSGSNGCGATDVILLTQSGGNTGHYYQLSDAITAGRGGTPANLPAELANTGTLNSSKCHVDAGPTTVAIAGTQGTQAPSPLNSNGQTGDASSSCEANAGTSLAWVMCPLFSAMSSIVQSTINIFENLLSFTGSDLGSPNCPVSDQSCQTGTSVWTTWSILKNLASIVLVIVMLIMVFSQAVSFGPFDAYTIRKMLPKLVAAVILMQLSWPLVTWVIDVFNDVGKGLQDLLFAPFGGSSTLNDLGRLINHAGISTAEAGVFNWVGLLGVGIATVAALPTALFLAFAAVLGLLVAVITLIFRKVLIILLVIFAPLAIIAWTLPGTQRYWKLWSDNLLKVLAMYPLVVALVAGGRIFAYVAGPQTTGLDGFAARLLALLFVLVGFIGPLFILPRTFKWGGSIMAAAGGAIAQMENRINKSAEQPIKGFGERIQGWGASKYNPNKEQAGWASRTSRRILSGNVVPFSKRSQRLAIAKGDKWKQERLEEALALDKRKGEFAMKNGYETAVLTDDNTSFAKYRTDAAGNILNKRGRVRYQKQADGSFRDVRTGQATTDFKDADKVAVSSYDEADKRTLYGVAAMKQMWVDLADEGRDDFEKTAAIRQLIATSSWPEVQGSLSRKGNKVIDTESWANVVTTSPEDYPKVLRSRVDATPHIDNAAKQALAQAKASGQVFKSAQEEKDFISSFRVKYSIEKQMSNEDFATQSDGYWEEVARTANMKDSNGQLTRDAQEIQTALRARLQAIHDIGGTAPQQLLGHLQNGGALQKNVESALGVDAGQLSMYLKAQEQIPDAIRVSAEGGSVITPSGTSYSTGNVPGGQRTVEITPEIIQGMSPDNAVGWVESRGGYPSMSNEDLVALYNNYTPQLAPYEATDEQKDLINATNERRRAVQQAARDELVRRGALNPQGPNLPAGGPPPAPPPAPPPPPAPEGGGNPGAGDLIVPHDTPAEDFGPEGRFPPPNIPPGPNV